MLNLTNQRRRQKRRRLTTKGNYRHTREGWYPAGKARDVGEGFRFGLSHPTPLDGCSAC